MLYNVLIEFGWGGLLMKMKADGFKVTLRGFKYYVEK